MHCSKSCLLFVVLCGLLSASVSAAPAPLTPIGKIARIVILGSKNVPESDIRAALTEKVGDAYSPAAAEKYRAAVQALGFFNEAVAESAMPDPAGGVALTFTVVEYPLVTAIKFVADTPNTQPSVPAAQLLSKMSLKVGQVLNVSTLDKDITTLFNLQTGYVAQQGYLMDVTADLSINPITGVLTFPLAERRIESIVITGNSRTKTVDILARMKTRPGDIYSAAALKKDELAIYAMGAFREVNKESWEEAGPGLVRVTLPVVETETATIDHLDEAQGRVIPFQYDPITCPYPVIQISIDGKPPLPFIVDTGTNVPLTLDPWAVKALGLTASARTQQQNGIVNAPVTIQTAVFQGKSADDVVTFHITEARAVDLSFIPDAFRGVHIAGIVGVGMLAPITTRFDFAAKTLTVYGYTHPPLRVPGAETLPLTVDSSGIRTVQVTLAPGVTDTLVFDTGSTSTQIHRTAAQTLHPSAVGYTFGGRIDGWYRNPALRLPEITLGALRVPNVLLQTMENSTSAVSIGLDILAGYRLTLDGPNRELTLEPSAAGGRYTRGWSGVELRQDARKNWLVESLRAGSPALKAGLRVGDAVETISGLAADGLPDAQFRALINGLAGRTVSVTGRRNGQMQTLSWVPLNAVTAPHDALYGLTMRLSNGGPWEILDVLPGSPAANAGLRTGDKITSLGGHLVASTSLDQEAHLVYQSPLPLMVTRAGRKTPFAVTLTAPSQKK